MARLLLIPISYILLTIILHQVPDAVVKVEVRVDGRVIIKYNKDLIVIPFSVATCEPRCRVTSLLADSLHYTALLLRYYFFLTFYQHTPIF